MPAKAAAGRKATPPRDYSTKIAAGVTAGECVQLLAVHGAEAVGLEFDRETRQPSGLSFRIETRWGVRGYRLPVRPEGVHAQLLAAREAGLIVKAGGVSAAALTTPGHAHAVAWRQLKDWLAAQIAMIEAGMWELPEVMLPWQLVSEGETVYQVVNEGALRAIGAARE
jgi:hypothetical protein